MFSGSPQRWEILKKNIECSLHKLSDTRWSARIDAVKPFANHLPGLECALEELSKLKLTSETRADLNGILQYVRTFECLLMGSIWFKILSTINERSVILQAMDATIYVEVQNLISDLQFIRDGWNSILQESQHVASGLKNTSKTLELPTSSRRKKQREQSIEMKSSGSGDSDEIVDFKVNTFLVIVDSVIGGISH